MSTTCDEFCHHQKHRHLREGISTADIRGMTYADLRTVLRLRHTAIPHGANRAKLIALIRKSEKDDVGGYYGSYWQSPPGIQMRISQLSSNFTYRIVNNAVKITAQEEKAKYLVWVTVGDDRVCFPAGSLVTTERGNVPIEKIGVGERVLTRNGFKKVITTINRPYNGRMTTIEHEKGSLTSTFDHPIWKIGQGWIAAYQIQVGDFLKTTDDERSRVSRVSQFCVTNSDNVPSLPNKKLGFPSISTRIFVPISPINLQCNPKLKNQEVNTVSTHHSFLDIFKFERIKNLTNCFLQQCFTLIFTIACKTTKLSILITRQGSKLLSTISAINILRWTPTYFATISPIQVLLSPKDFATPPTRNIFGISSSTSSTTNRISISNRTINLKCFTTLWTNLLHLLGFPLTSLGTKPFPSLHSRGHQIKTDPTMRTDSPFAPSSPLLDLSLHQPMINRHNNQSLSSNYLKVYNLEVEDEPEYFVNDILVHNCPICEPRHMKMYKTTYFLPRLPAHNGCRCVWQINWE